MGKVVPNPGYDSVHARLLNQIITGFASDEVDMLVDLRTHLSPLILRAIPGPVLRSFAERLRTLAPAPTHAHAALLVHCIDANVVDEREVVEWMDPILKLSNLDQWWSDELVGHCLCQGMTEGSALCSVVERLVDLWLLRAAHTQVSTTSVYHTMASLVTGTYQFDNPLRLPHVFLALATFRPSVVKTIFNASGPAIWKAFLHRMSMRSAANAHPLMLSPLVAQQLHPYALNRGWLYGTNLQELMEEILTTMDMFIENNNVVPVNVHLPWTMSWLGYFSLAHSLFGTEEFEWDLLSDDFVERLLTTALQHPVWWSHADVTPNWGWAATMVRLLAVFVRPANRELCHTAACTVARQLVTMVDIDDLTGKNWAVRVPIFPYPCDFGRFLWLLNDYDVMNSDALPILVKSQTVAILNRLRAVKPVHWTSMAAACVVQHGATRRIGHM